MSEHKQKLIDGFTSKYNVNKLIWIEFFERVEDAIMVEKKIKGWKRSKKIQLIQETNPDFKDLLCDEETLHIGSG